MFKAALLACLAIILSGCETAKKDVIYKGKVSGKEFTDVYCHPKHLTTVNKPQKDETFKLDSHTIPNITECKK